MSLKVQEKRSDSSSFSGSTSARSGGHLPWYWVNRPVYEYFAANIGVRLGRSKPILIYQMGKVGSSSIRNSLFRCRAMQTGLVLMSHEFYPARHRQVSDLAVDPGDSRDAEREIAHARQAYKRLSVRQRIGLRFREKLYSEMIYNNVVRKRKPAKIITLVREPIGNNVSMFFQTFDEYVDSGRGLADYEIDELVAVFLDRYVHSRPLIWLDAELRTTLGIDVYAAPFPIERGHVTIRGGPFELLVLKCELSDSEKESAIAGFVGIDDLKLIRSNVTKNKDHGRQYEEFRRRIKLPDSYLDYVYGSKYARFFYSDAERAKFRAHWSRRDGS